MKGQTGSVQVVAIVLLVCGLIGALGYIGWHNIINKTDAVDKSVSKTPQDKERPLASSSPAKMPSADANEGYLLLDSWGVRFKPAGTAKITYEQKNDGYWFTTEKWRYLGGVCADHGGILLVRMKEKNTHPASPPQPLNNELKINGYYYYYEGPQAACSDDAPFQEGAENKIIRDLLSTIEAKR